MDSRLSSPLFLALEKNDPHHFYYYVIRQKVSVIEALFGIVTVMVELFVSVISAIVELIAGFFAVSGEALTASEAIIVLFAFIAEIIFWGVLWLRELILALFQWRKPEKVHRPKLYTKKSERKNKNEEQ